MALQSTTERKKQGRLGNPCGIPSRAVLVRQESAKQATSGAFHDCIPHHPRTQRPVFTFREDGWFNMTKAAKHFGEEVKEYLRLPSTVEYIDALLNVGISHLYDAQQGRYGGTWAHPKLAVFFARWLDVKFSVWCDAVIEDILKGVADATITKPQESSVMALPVE